MHNTLKSFIELVALSLTTCSQIIRSSRTRPSVQFGVACSVVKSIDRTIIKPLPHHLDKNSLFWCFYRPSSCQPTHMLSPCPWLLFYHLGLYSVFFHHLLSSNWWPTHSSKSYSRSSLLMAGSGWLFITSLSLSFLNFDILLSRSIFVISDWRHMLYFKRSSVSLNPSPQIFLDREN